jgi:hypothetical protein
MGDLYSNKANAFHLHVTLFCFAMQVTGIGPTPIQNIILVMSLEKLVKFRQR